LFLFFFFLDPASVVFILVFFVFGRAIRLEQRTEDLFYGVRSYLLPRAVPPPVLPISLSCRFRAFPRLVFLASALWGCHFSFSFYDASFNGFFFCFLYLVRVKPAALSAIPPAQAVALSNGVGPLASKAFSNDPLEQAAIDSLTKVPAHPPPTSLFPSSCCWSRAPLFGRAHGIVIGVPSFFPTLRCHQFDPLPFLIRTPSFFWWSWRLFCGVSKSATVFHESLGVFQITTPLFFFFLSVTRGWPILGGGPPPQFGRPLTSVRGALFCEPPRGAS